MLLLVDKMPYPPALQFTPEKATNDVNIETLKAEYEKRKSANLILMSGPPLLNAPDDDDSKGSESSRLSSRRKSAVTPGMTMQVKSPTRMRSHSIHPGFGLPKVAEK